MKNPIFENVSYTVASQFEDVKKAANDKWRQVLLNQIKKAIDYVATMKASDFKEYHTISMSTYQKVIRPYINWYLMYYHPASFTGMKEE